MNYVVLAQNDAILGIYSTIEIAKAFASQHYLQRYKISGRPMEDFNYRYLDFTVNSIAR